MNSRDLEKLPDEELRKLYSSIHAEQSRRAAEDLQRRQIENAQMLKKLLPHKEVILGLLQHARTSCSDDNPQNGIEEQGRYRCAKCALMELLAEAEYAHQIHYSVCFDVRICKET